MTYPVPADVQYLVSEGIAAGDYPSKDDVLRDALRALAEEKKDLHADQEAIVDWRAGGERIPLPYAFDVLRWRYRHDVSDRRAEIRR